MAKIKFSALVQEMRNKLNGSVLSKNRYGNYVRNKTTPVNPQTEYQQAQRARLSSVSQLWATITDAARQGFADLANAHPFTDIFGDQKFLDGKAMFAKVNLNLLSAGQSTINAPVAFKGVPFIELTAVTADVSDAEIEVTASSATVPAGYTLVLQATPPMPPTVGFVKNQYRDIGTAALTTSAADITALYNARFGSGWTTKLGSVIHVRGFLVDNTTGQSGIASAVNGSIVP